MSKEDDDDTSFKDSSKQSNGDDEKADKRTGYREAADESNLLAQCSVCSGPAATHVHYGAISCYSCRAFFRRGVPKQVRCAFGHDKCKITRQNRTGCKLCRYNRCLEVGMKPERVDYYLNKRKEKELNKDIH